MADIYKPVTNYIDTGIQPSGQTVGGQGSEVDEYINSLPPEEREAAIKRLTAPASTAEIAKSALASGRPPTMDEFRAIREYNKTKEVDVLEAIGNGFSGVMTDLSNAMGSAWDDPVHALKTAPANVIEGFGQGTRNFYGMLAQSADPSSKLFRLKSVLGGTDSDAEQYRQYMDAWNFNKHSEDIISGKTTVIMDKDMIDPHIAQAMSYVLDPTLFIPFGEVASGGIKAIGMGEKLTEIAARTSAIKAKVLGGTLKWGVGAPIEFMGTAVRNTIDYGIERGAAGFEAISGVPAKEFQTTARLSGWGTAAASVGGYHIPYASTISEFMVGSRAAQGIGEAISAIGDQIIKQKGNRGILSYAGQALADTEKVGGIQLSSHAKSLLKIADAVDPLFGFANEITKGAAHGAMIGAGLGYASGGEEGMAHGIGAGMALGAVGGGFGKVVNEATNIGLYDRTAIQRKMVIEGLKQVGGNMDKAMAFEAMVKTAEATGNRHYMAEVDGIIAAFDKIAPNAKLIVRDNASHEQFLKDNRIDPATGRLIEKSQILPDVTSRSMTADALAVLRDNGDMFMGNSKQFLDTINTDKKYARQKKAFEALDPTAQKAVLGRIDDHADSSFRSSLKGMSIKDYYGHLNYAERLADTVNKIAINTSEEAGRAKINEFLKGETVKGQLTRRGKMLKDKLAADGWFDKDGKMLARRDTQGETPLEKFKGSAGFVFRRDATGQVEIHLNTSALGDTTIPHELFHAVMMDSVLKPDFMDRWVQKLIGKYDDKGNMLEAGSAHISEVKKFFEKYIESENRNDPEAIRIKKEELQKSLEEYQSRGKNERISDKTVVPLEHYAEEFGAYYFQKWLRGKPVDYLFRGGDLGGIRGLLESAKGSWLDFWQSKIQQQNPSFDFNNIKDYKISQAFEKDGKRVRISAFDLFMQDFVRANSNLNKESGFDLSRLSQEAQAQFINANGIRGYGKTDATGRVIRYNQRKAIAEEIRVGKEIYKILNSLDPALRKGGTTTDGEGNISGKPNTAEIDAIVKSGLVSRAWCDKVMRGFDIVEGNGGNVIYFGYLGRTAQIGDYAWPRLVGSDVPFKNRAAILFGVDFKVGADGKMHSLFHTLDKQVIEARGNNLWKDANIRDLWDGDRASMEADFFKYLSNASKSSSDTSRRPSHLLLDRGDGLGAQRRNALHQMLGMAKGENEVYINKPTSEIPYGIRQSVTTFNVDGISNLRVDNGVRYDYKDVNAGKDLSRNFMPSEMKSEDTPSGGKLIKHATGYNISKQAGEKFKVFSPEGKMLGAFDTIADAGRAAQKHFNESYDKSVEGKDKPVPATEIPPSRQAFIEKGSAISIDKYFGNHVEKFRENLNVLIDRVINGSKQDSISKDAVNSKLTKIKESISEGNVKISDLQYLVERANNTLVDTSRLPYFDYNYFWERIGRVIEDSINNRGAEYDAMYPMEIKSALHPRLAQIFQDYPNLTAQGLLKKLVVYGSQGSRMFQEATEIGLVDLLKSKIQKTTTPRFLPDGRMIEMTQGVTQPKLNMTEILDFAKSKEIKVTIEEGARELSGMDTSRYTLGGAKDNYKQTAIRINPEYAHGIRGHYGENTIVHFRTTERIDADGNRHLFIEEVQANNTDKSKSNGEYITPEQARVSKEIARRIVANQYASKLKKLEKSLDRKRDVVEEFNQYDLNNADILSATGARKINRQKELFNIILRNYIDAYRQNNSEYISNLRRVTEKGGTYEIKEGAFDSDIRTGWKNTRDIVESNSLLAELEKHFITETDTKTIWRKLIEIQKNIDLYESSLRGYAGRRKVPTIDETLQLETYKILEEIRAGSGHITDDLISLIINKEKNKPETEYEYLIDNVARRLPSIPTDLGRSKFITNTDAKDKLLSELVDSFSKDKDVREFIKEHNKVQNYVDAIKADLNSIGDVSYFSYSNGTEIEYINPDRLNEIVSLANTAIDKFNTQGKEPVFPLTSARDWTLTALKGIIRQAIRDGLDKITLTHPDDSPTVSHMKGDARHGLYGKLIPEVWSSWLRKYGIEMKQTNKLANATIDTAKAQMAEITNKLHDANKAVLDHFEQVKNGEDPATINKLAELMAMPVHESDNKIGSRITVEALKINDDKLRTLIGEVALLKESEKSAYNKVQKLREGGVRAVSDIKSDTDAGISAEAIDRGMTFELNDRIKRDFLDGKIQTHAMPAEGRDPYEGGRTYDQNSRQWKAGFLGLYAEQNPERVNGLNLQFIKRTDGSHRIRLTDNSKKGESADVGHITANIEGDRATLSSHINEDYRGKKLAYVVYSEMAERLRAMGVTAVDGQIVNPDGIPVKVREAIIGDTRDLYSGKRINYVEAANRIQDKQALVGSMGGVDVTNTLFKQARYMPAEGEEPIRLSGKKKTISTKKVSTNQFETEEGIGRTYDTDSRKWTNGFIGRYAEENPILIKGLKLSMKNWDNRTDDYGRRSIELKEGNKLVGRIDYEVKKGSGGKWLLSDPSVRVWEQYRGKGYSNLLYSEMAERARFLGAEDFLQRIENEQALPMYAQVKTFGFGESKLIDADRGKYYPPTKENFDKLKKPLTEILHQDGSIETMEGYEPWVHSWSKIFPDRHYMPAEEKVPDRDTAFNRIYRDISRSKKAATRSIKQAYLDKWGIDLSDYERYQQLKESLYRLERDAEDGKDVPDFISDKRDLKSEISDLENFMTGRIQEVQGEYAYQFTDQLDELERGISRIDTVINQISKQPVKNIDIHQGDNRLEKVLFRELKSGYTQDISGMDIPIADAFREFAGMEYEKKIIGAAFESELYNSDYITPQKGRHHYTIPASEGSNKKGILVDILRSENKLTEKGLPQGEVNPRRIINALRNKSGGDSKVYAEAKAIGLIDWLESKQEGKSQKKVTTKELIEFVESNKMGLTIDPQLEQDADFGTTRPYVTGGAEQAGKGYRVYVVRMTNAKHEHGVAGHFEGAVVHVRVTLRNTKEGKKVMHIEEIQANNTATDVLSESQKQIVTKEIQQLYKFRKEKDDALLYTQAESSALKSRFGEGTKDYATADAERVNRWQKKRDEISQKYAESLYDLNPEYWKDKFTSNTERDRDGYVKLVSKYLLSHNETILISEKETSLNNTKNNAPLQDPKEWVKVAFRTVLRKALVEGVDRITITPWDETPIQVGMKAKSAERFYGGTVRETFNSELAKMNAVLSPEGKHESIPREIYNRSKVSTNNAIQKVATNFDAKYAQSKGADIETIFKLLHTDDADLATNHSRKALEDRMTFLLKGVPEDTDGKLELTIALQRKSNQFQDYLDIQDSIAGGKHPSGLEVRASAAGMSSSEYLVDRSLGFDLTPEMKKKAARPQRLMQPAEGWRDWKSERTSVGSVIHNAIGYVIMVQNDKFKVYSPAKALIGIYGNEDQAKRRVQKDEPKQ